MKKIGNTKIINTPNNFIGLLISFFPFFCIFVIIYAIVITTTILANSDG